MREVQIQLGLEQEARQMVEVQAQISMESQQKAEDLQKQVLEKEALLVQARAQLEEAR